MSERHPAPGTVYLVGAGPGDPGLLTMRAAELLRSAEVVAHDLLIPEAILRLIPSDAERLPVGRRHGDGHVVQRIHPAVLERAQAGRHVVRLKAGDPLVFGRGGEEAEALAEAGIPFQIVPGITSALGAAAYAGMPLTHRDHSSDVLLATGHDADGDYESHTRWDRVAAGSGTLVLYMATRRVRGNMARLMAAGRDPESPAACVAAATRSGQRVIVSTLAELADAIADAEPGIPALVLVGDTVGLHGRIAWLERCPLLGKQLIVARARPGRSGIAAHLRALGASVTEAPRFRAIPLPRVSAPVPMASIHAVVFACEAGLDAYVQASGGTESVMKTVGTVPVVAIGPGVGRRLTTLGIVPQSTTDGACAEALAALPGFWQGRTVLLPTSDRGRPQLVADLNRLGATVHTEAVYRLRATMPDLPDFPGDLLILPSSSAAKALLEASPELRALPAVAMGPHTADTASALGVSEIALAARDTPAAMVDAALRCLGGPDPSVLSAALFTDAERQQSTAARLNGRVRA